MERKASKAVKKLEREAEALLRASTAASERASSIGSPASTTSTATLEGGDGILEEQLVETMERIVEEREADASVEEEPASTPETAEPEDPPPLWHLGAEHTRLQPEEAFFLLFSLGVLSLRSSSPFSDDPTPSAPLSVLSTWRTFLEDSAILLTPLPTPTAGLKLAPKDDPRLSRFDSPFLIAYASYHHFRSMGWVVRSGVKFCCEWVLYGPGGPVGSHAE